jgi:tetratricopeptide (TPR) repeat protein
VTRSLLLALRAMRAVAFEQSAEARALVESAQETADALGDDATATSAALLARAWSLLGSPRPHVLRETADRALFLADRSPFRLLLRYLLVPVLAVPPLQVGDLAGYESVRQRVGSHPEIRPDLAEGNLATWDAAMAISAGRFAEVDRLAAAATDDYSIRPQVAQFQVGRAALDRGAYADAGRWAIDYASIAPSAVAPQAALAWLRAEADDHADARRWIETLRGQRPLDQLGWGAPLALRCLAEAAANLGDPDLAGDLLPVLSEYAGQMLVAYTAMTVEGAADRAIGVTLLALGRHDEAVERLDAALRLEESCGADALAARTMCWQARALLARGAPGDTDAARRIADRAAATARPLGMPRLAADAVALSDQSR